MILKNFNHQLISAYFNRILKTERIDFKTEIEIPDLNFLAVKKFAKKNKIEDKYIFDLCATLFLCIKINESTRLFDEIKIRFTRKSPNSFFDLLEILRGEIEEMEIRGSKKKYIFNKNEVKYLMEFFIKKNDLKSFIDDPLVTKRKFLKRSHHRLNLKILARTMRLIFLEFGLKFKSNSQMYIMIYDFLKLAGYFQDKNISAPEELIKKLFQIDKEYLVQN